VCEWLPSILASIAWGQTHIDPSHTTHIYSPQLSHFSQHTNASSCPITSTCVLRACSIPRPPITPAPLLAKRGKSTSLASLVHVPLRSLTYRRGDSQVKQPHACPRGQEGDGRVATDHRTLHARHRGVVSVRLLDARISRNSLGSRRGHK
jgi:hypothetical protein